MSEIKLWALEKDGSGSLVAEPVENTDHTETEKQLEDLLVKSPDLLMKGLKLVGRQTPTGGGALDLLGVNEDGNLVVFELKRGILTRDAIAQAIDYASYLADLGSEDLSIHISERSGTDGIEKIQDFDEWFQEEFPTNSDGYADRPGMVLVGLGADERTRRMVDFLSEGGLDISLLTFHAFVKNDKMFLARQVETQPPRLGPRDQRRYTKTENLEALKDLSSRAGSDRLLEEMADFFRKEPKVYEWPSRSGYSYSLVEQTERGTPSYRVYVSIYVSEPRKGQVQLVFQQRAVQAAKKDFSQLLTQHSARFDESHGKVQTWVQSESDWDDLCNSIKSVWSGIIQGWQAKTQEENAPAL